MNDETLEVSLTELLRRKVLLGAARPIALNTPLGASGVGLDSLGLAEFLSAAEESYGVELPRWIWGDVGRLSLHDLAREVRAARLP